MNAVAKVSARAGVPRRSFRTMRAAIVSAPGKIEIVETEVPKSKPN